ncbi:hypothetical protein [Saccharothrix hoggarensis]|uniref:Immunity protein 21 of polymorphic toxin system n=1 Tax=Saccharothrix hoggarensis TaxID=913853 RepID=A0ABW3QRD0_9PSEU
MTAFDDTVDVEYSQFCLQDMARNNSPLALEVPDGDDWLMVGGLGGVLFHSTDTDHNPPIRLELWSTRPTAPTASWHDSAEAVFRTESEEVRLWSPTAAMGEHTVPLPGPGEYHVEAFVRGREESDEHFAGDEREHWLVRIWPVSDPPLNVHH